MNIEENLLRQVLDVVGPCASDVYELCYRHDDHTWGADGRFAVNQAAIKDGRAMAICPVQRLAAKVNGGEAWPWPRLKEALGEQEPSA